jgi:hypothetical protein
VRIRVVHRVGDVDLDLSDGADDALEPGEPGEDVRVDPDAGQALHGVDEEFGSPA